MIPAAFLLLALALTVVLVLEQRAARRKDDTARNRRIADRYRG